MATKIQKETVKKLVKVANRRISRANKTFEKMTPSEKRVQIARDVLVQLDSKRLTAICGIWLSGKNEKGLFNEVDIKKNLELKDVLAKVKRCEGCALGGMFMCAVERADKLKLNQLDTVKEINRPYYYRNSYRDSYSDGLISEDDAFSYMKKFFKLDQLNMIESAFENGDGATNHAYGADFVCGIDDPQTRMRLIMENIVTNKGTFCPDKKPLATWITPGYKK